MRGRKQPPFAGSSGLVIDLNTQRTPVTRPVSVQLIGPDGLFVSAGKIHDHVLRGQGDLHLDPERPMAQAVAFDHVLGLIHTGRAASPAPPESCARHSRADSPWHPLPCPTPYFSTMSDSRRAPTFAAATPAYISPIVLSGSRTLALIMATNALLMRPPSYSFTKGTAAPPGRSRSTASTLSRPGRHPLQSNAPC